MKDLLRDSRIRRLLLANITGSVGSGVTIIAVPWLLVPRPDGDALYGYVTMATTLVLFLFMPYYGTWLDRHSRKAMLLIGELFGFTATASMAAWAALSGRVEVWQLMVSYFCGMLYYTLHYPAKYAFLQQVIDRRHYQSLTGLMEVQGQTASVLAGGLAGLLIDHVPLWVILAADASTYLFSFFVQSTLPYQPTHLQDGHKPPASAWHGMAEGWRWLDERRALSFFFGCTLVPFILVMVSNYLFPVYVADVLHASARVFGNGEIVFALGALLAGLWIPKLATERGADRIIVATIGLCLMAIAFLAAHAAAWTYYLAMVLFGLGNAGCRVARNAVMLHLVPNRVMGRIGVFFSASDRLLRTVLTFACTALLAHGGARSGFVLLGTVLVAAYAGTLATRHAVRAAEAAGHA